MADSCSVEQKRKEQKRKEQKRKEQKRKEQKAEKGVSATEPGNRNDH